VFILLCTVQSYSSDNQIISAPLFSDSAGKTGPQAISSVFRILCPSQGRMGTGFLHKSGWVLTAGHVIKNCEPKDVAVLISNNTRVSIKKIISDDDIDIALLLPEKRLDGKPLLISELKTLTVGSQVSTWGFPSGYNGRLPILSVGYLSGVDTIKSINDKLVQRFVVNAAFNSGNSGGPLLDVETGSVIGIVASKLAPIPPYIENALKALKDSKYGVMFKKTNTDGSEEKISQSQVLEEILQYMRSQTQLVVGMAVRLDDIKSFLIKESIDP
jgi:S1-C subfamily serine protease